MDGLSFRAAVFDVDGVLVDSPHEKAWRESLRVHVRRAFQYAEGLAKPAPLSEREKRFALPFKAVAAPGLRVVGTTGEGRPRPGIVGSRAHRSPRSRKSA